VSDLLRRSGIFAKLFQQQLICPLAINEILKVMSFMEAANTSMYNGGRTETLVL
jgi:hypothetical protein|tara:strand:- start:335 stop:496 length:162 start_codon:yes stop_codon:yes gene_type:complete